MQVNSESRKKVHDGITQSWVRRSTLARFLMLLALRQTVSVKRWLLQPGALTLAT